MIGKNPFELGKKNFNLALGMGPYFGPMRAQEKGLITDRWKAPYIDKLTNTDRWKAPYIDKLTNSL